MEGSSHLCGTSRRPDPRRVSASHSTSARREHPHVMEPEPLVEADDRSIVGVGQQAHVRAAGGSRHARHVRRDGAREALASCPLEGHHVVDVGHVAELHQGPEGHDLTAAIPHSEPALAARGEHLAFDGGQLCQCFIAARTNSASDAPATSHSSSPGRSSSTRRSPSSGGSSLSSITRSQVSR